MLSHLSASLRTTTQTEYQVRGGLLLDVVVGKGAAVLQLLASENQTLLIRRDTLLVLDLGLDVVESIVGLNLEGVSRAGQSLHRDLHPTTQTEYQVQSGLPLDVAVGKGEAVLQLLASEDQTLLIRRDTLLVLDLGLDVVDSIVGLNLEGDTRINITVVAHLGG